MILAYLSALIIWGIGFYGRGGGLVPDLAAEERPAFELAWSYDLFSPCALIIAMTHHEDESN